MRSVFYTKSKEEYQLLAKLTLEEIPDTVYSCIETDGHYHFIDCDMAVITLDGALGMEIMLEYRRRYPEALIIWVTNDEYFAKMAIRNNIFDFILRPLTEERFLETVRRVNFIWRNRA